MKENSSPEEKLLRLIRGKKQPEAQAGSGGRAQQAALRAAVAGRASRLKELFPLKRALAIALVLACVYLAISLAWPCFGLRKISLPAAPAANPPQPDKEEKAPAESFDSYVKDIQRRSIFQASGKGGGPAPISVASVDAVKDINLMGIITGSSPQAIIEDKRSQKTYYVSSGQSVGDIVIEQILEGKVIIGYQGQHYELHL